MKKRVISLILAALLSFVFVAGCTPNSQGEISAKAFTPNDSYTVGNPFTLKLSDYFNNADDSTTYQTNKGSIDNSNVLTIPLVQIGQLQVDIVATKDGKNATLSFTLNVVSDDGGDITPVESPWDNEPEVNSVFYSDFGAADNVESKWALVNYGWGQNGVLASNAGYTRAPALLKKNDATGGIAVLPSYGDYYSASGQRGQGTCLITKDQFGPGLYEVRMKVVPRFGPCTAVWSYYTNSYAITNQKTGSLEYGHNTDNNIQYNEIDIEAPAQGQGFHAWGGVAYEEYYQNADDINESTGSGRTVNKSRGVRANCESTYNDGQWHTFAFEWRTKDYTYDKSKETPSNPPDEVNDGAIIWYMDGKEVARTAQRTPYYPCQLWVGNWFPNNATDWLGIADFDEAYMYVDWVRITEYNDPVITTNRLDGNNPNAPIVPDWGGCVTFSTQAGGNKNYGTNMPINNYVSNGTFSQGNGTNALGWTLESATRATNKLTINSAGKAVQNISAQYNGYSFRLTADGAVTAGSGKCKIYVEYLNCTYQNNTNSNSKITNTKVVGQSQAIEISSAEAAAGKYIDITLPALNADDFDNTYINNIRIVIQNENGVTAEITKLVMNLLSDL